MLRTILKLIEVGAKKVDQFDRKVVKELEKWEKQKGGKQDEGNKAN